MYDKEPPRSKLLVSVPNWCCAGGSLILLINKPPVFGFSKIQIRIR
jgi:hypothetical protein